MTVLVSRQPHFLQLHWRKHIFWNCCYLPVRKCLSCQCISQKAIKSCSKIGSVWCCFWTCKNFWASCSWFFYSITLPAGWLFRQDKLPLFEINFLYKHIFSPNIFGNTHTSSQLLLVAQTAFTAWFFFPLTAVEAHCARVFGCLISLTYRAWSQNKDSWKQSFISQAYKPKWQHSDKETERTLTVAETRILLWLFLSKSNAENWHSYFWLRGWVALKCGGKTQPTAHCFHSFSSLAAQQTRVRPTSATKQKLQLQPFKEIGLAQRNIGQNAGVSIHL